MAQQTIQATDTLNAGRTKINDNFTELYAGGNVVASLAEAQAGTDNTKFMSPQRVAEVTSRVFNVKAYGAKGDCQAAMIQIASGSTIVTSYLSIFAPSDVGKSIKIPTAGPSNDELLTIITGYTSPTQVTIAAATSSALATIAVYDTDKKQAKGRIVAGSLNTFTALSSTFSAGDVGKSITIDYVGNAAGTQKLVTTIASYISPTQVTLTTPASIPTTVEAFFGTDDTAAIQATINAAFNANGGEVYFPVGKYAIAGALVTSDVNGLNPNSQLYIPASTTTSERARPRPLRFTGEATSPPFYTDGLQFGGVGIINFRSKGTGTLPAMIGGKGTNGNNLIADWNTTPVYWEHITLVMSTNNAFGSNMIGFNGLDLTVTNARNFHCLVDIHTYALNFANPAGTGFTGFVFGKIDNNTGNHFSNVVAAGGFEYGIVLGEHVYADGMVTATCYYGFTFLNTNFTVTGSFYGAFNRHDLYFPDVLTPFFNLLGTSFVDINFGQESSGISGAPNWIHALGTSIIKDVSNYGRGNIVYNGQNGNDNLTKIGGTFIYTPNIRNIYQQANQYYPTQGLTAYFAFEEPSGNFLSQDGFGFTNSLVPTGTVNRVAALVSNGVQIPAGSNYLSSADGNNSVSPGPDGFSVDFWVKLDYVQSNSNLLSKWGTAGNREYAIYWSGDQVRFAWTTDGTNSAGDIGSNPILPYGDSLFHHIAISWDGTTVSLFLDGVLQNQEPCKGIFNVGSEKVEIARDIFSSGVNTRGTFDQLVFRKKPISRNDVLYLHNAGLGRAYNRPTNPTITAWSNTGTFPSVIAPSYTVAGVPSASGIAGATIYVSNESGGAVLAFSDGTNWRRVTDRAIIS